MIDKLNVEIAHVQSMPQVAKQLDLEAAEAIRMSPTEFASYIAAELRKWEPVIKGAGIKAE